LPAIKKAVLEKPEERRFENGVVAYVNLALLWADPAQHRSVF
jgi:hypothetical protein